LRADLADNLREWLIQRLELRQKAICEPSTRSLTGATELRAGVSGNTEASRLSPDDPLFGPNVGKDEVLRTLKQRRSVFDILELESSSSKRVLSKDDRDKLEEYTTSIRDIERSISF
jgi:hypothetical protein